MVSRILVLTVLASLTVGCGARKSQTDQGALQASKNATAEASTHVPAEVGELTEAAPAEPPKTYGVGEVLSYKLTWNKFSVGTMNISILPRATVNGKPAWKYRLRATTNSFADSIYKVRLNLKSYMDDARTCSLLYESQAIEGSKDRSKTFEFDWDKKKVHYLKNRAEDRGWRDLPEKCYDPLAMFYALREMPIDETVKELSVWVSDGKKSLHAKAAVVCRERIKDDNDTSYDTYLIEPDLKDLKGVFEKSDDAKLQLWVSNDQYRIPVKISSKVTIGSFTATLTKHQAHDK